MAILCNHENMSSKGLDQAKRAIKGHRFVFMRNEENHDSHGQRIPEMIQMAKTVERHLRRTEKRKKG